MHASANWFPTICSEDRADGITAKKRTTSTHLTFVVSIPTVQASSCDLRPPEFEVVNSRSAATLGDYTRRPGECNTCVTNSKLAVLLLRLRRASSIWPTRTAAQLRCSG